MVETDFTRIFEAQFSKPTSAIEAQAGLAAMGDEYPAGLETYSWASRTELRRVVDQVAITGAGVVVDVGCGRGGPGLWVAGTTGARLVGVDIAESALERARALATRLGVEARFQIGSFEAVGLADGAADLVMSFDAFLFTPDKRAAFKEITRVLRPGGRLVMTSWDYHAQPRNRPPQVDDHRPMAEAAGLTVVVYEETEDWRGRCVRFADYLLERRDDMAREANVSTAEMSAALADMRASIDLMIRRVLLIAENPKR